MIRILSIVGFFALAMLSASFAEEPAIVPSTTPTTSSAELQPVFQWKALDPIIGVPGSLADDVYTFTLPRTDFTLRIDGMDVPIAAGVASVFHFFRCPCGHGLVVGQLCVIEGESNEVVDALRADKLITVSSVGPMAIEERPRVMLIRFQGEGDSLAMAKSLKNALDWMGENRTAKQPIGFPNAETRNPNQ